MGGMHCIARGRSRTSGGRRNQGLVMPTSTDIAGGSSIRSSASVAEKARSRHRSGAEPRSTGNPIEAYRRLAPLRDTEQPTVPEAGSGKLDPVRKTVRRQARRERKRGESDERPERAKAGVPRGVEPR